MHGTGRLTKSVQALVLLIIIILYLVLTRQYAELKTRPFWGNGGSCAVAADPVVSSANAVQPGIFRRSNHQADFSPRPGQDSSSSCAWSVLFQVIYFGFFPWSLLAVPAMSIAFWQAIQRKNREMIFLLTWIFTVFIGFSISKMKAVWYMNPLYPALALLIAMVGYTIIVSLKMRYPASPLLARLQS